jgi:hypothetical protein
MPFEKGKNKTGGRTKGKSNKKTEQWELLGESIANQHTEKFNSILDKLEGREFINAYLQTLEYFKPKLQRTELAGDKDNPININPVDFVKPSDKS